MATVLLRREDMLFGFVESPLPKEAIKKIAEVCLLPFGASIDLLNTSSQRLLMLAGKPTMQLRA